MSLYITSIFFILFIILSKKKNRINSDAAVAARIITNRLDGY